jgi:hypothetical protein
MRNINKKASTLTNWVFVIVGISLFLVLFQSEVLDPMNADYNKSFSVGLSTEAQTQIDKMDTQRASSKGELDSAEVSTLSDGITLIQIGSVALGTFRTLGEFVSGSFLSTLLTEQLDFPPIVATVLTIVIWMSLIFIIVRIFMRGVTP